MSFQSTELPRVFRFRHENKDLELADPDAGWSHHQVLSFYGNTYPELTTATVQGPEIIADKMVYTFSTSLGMKG